MKDTEKISDLLQEAKNTIAARIDHALVPKYRLRIYQHLQRRNYQGVLNRYQRLNIIVAKRVQQLWIEHILEENLPQQILRITQEVSEEKISSHEGEAVVMQCLDLLEKLGKNNSDPQLNRNIGVARTAIEALLAVLGKAPFDGIEILDEYSDADIDPWSSDAVLWAVGAIAGGVWDPESDKDKRYEFWLWWLNEAIPAAIAST